MRMLRLSTIIVLVCAVASAFSQSWNTAYDAGLKAAKAGKWSEAREAFLQAVASRPEDQSGPTNLPGPASEQRRWRNGSPYSPNFLAAYAAYKQGLAAGSSSDATTFLKSSAAELETLLSKKAISRETVYFLTTIYGKLGDTQKAQALASNIPATQEYKWKVDVEVVAPEELAAMSNSTKPVVADTIFPSNTNVVLTQPSANGSVAVIESKFALVVGQASSATAGLAVPFGSDNAQVIRSGLTSFAGYADANVDVVINPTADQLLTSAKALASRMPQGATLTLYFVGSGANINGKDYLACADTKDLKDTSSMVSKYDLYTLFTSKGAKIFSFFEVARPVVEGRYFGQEQPVLGSIAQMQSTMPGGQLLGTVKDGRALGVFTQAFVEALANLRSNQLPIGEFGWQVFFKMKRANSGSTGGGASQIPTLPVLTYLATDARF